MNDTNKPDFYESLRHAAQTLGNVARQTREANQRQGFFRQRDAVLAALRTAERQRDRKDKTIEDLDVRNNDLAETNHKLEQRCREYEQDLSAMSKDLMAEKETLREERMRAEELEKRLISANRKLEDQHRRHQRQLLITHELTHAIYRLGGTDEDIKYAWGNVNEFLDSAESGQEAPAADKWYAHDVMINPWLTGHHPTRDEKWRAFEVMFNELPHGEIVAEGNKPDLSKPDPDQQVLNELAFGASNKHLIKTLIDVAEGAPVTHMKSALLAAAADRLGVDVFPSYDALRRRPVSKGELAEALYPEDEGYQVDCALPQAWVDNTDGMLTEEQRTRINETGGVAWNFVTVYHDKYPGGVIMPVTRMGVLIMAAIASHM